MEKSTGKVEVINGLKTGKQALALLQGHGQRGKLPVEIGYDGPFVLPGKLGVEVGRAQVGQHGAHGGVRTNPLLAHGLARLILTQSFFRSTKKPLLRLSTSSFRSNP